MTAINWKATQANSAAAGYSPGSIDGRPGPKTYDALLAYAAGRRPEEIDDAIAIAAAEYCPKYEMTTPARLAEFLAQCCNETGGFRKFSENLSYSTGERIKATWPSRFKSAADAAPYVRNPEKLANFVYARPKEGNTAPGDGWRYRGRGMLQLTFKNAYRAFSDLVGIDLVSDPDRAADPGDSLLIALAFFKRGKVNDWVDRGNFKAARGITNAGDPNFPNPIGLDHVADLRKRLLKVIV